MKFTQLLLTVLIALGVSLGALHFQKPAGTVAAVAKETAYERVLRTGTLRCGYYPLPPLIIKDINTGKLSGLAHDFTTALAEATELKLLWQEEISFSTYLQDITNGRYDAECAEGWANAVRGKYAYYSKPYAYVPLVAVVRTDDKRFDNSPEAFNDAAVKMVTIDGETSQIITRLRFSKASQVSIPQNTAWTDQILNVVTGKADAVLVDALTAHGYIAANPGKVKMISYDPPIHLIPLGLTLPQDEKLRALMDIATDQLINNGTVAMLINKYATDGIVLLPSRVAETNN